MKVLITCEQRSYVPIIEYHYLGICAEAEVICATDPFWTSNLKFDIIHIHWPEYLVDYRIHDTNVLALLKERIEYWKSLGAKIVITRHNYLPHAKSELKPEIFAQIYDYLYSTADAIEHLANHSYNEFLEHPKYSLVKNIVIRHPNYLETLRNTITKTEARRKFKLNDSSIVFSTFGVIRHKEEEEQVIQAFSKLKIKNKNLIIPRSLFEKNKPGKSTPLRYIKYLLKKKRYLAHNILCDEKKIIDDLDIQNYMNAADIIISPRIDNLNSGILFLALSFGKIVIGPNVGNITELLETINNPIFEPNNPKSLNNAMIQAINLLGANTGEKNFQYIAKEGNIYKLGESRLDLYNDLINKK